jgi:methyl-accepting chemotaxis protein
MSIWTIAIMLVVVAGVAAILVRKASDISLELNKQKIEYLARQQVEFWKGREDGYIRVLNTLAKIMGDFETIPAQERRNRYDDMLYSALEAEANMVTLYTIWKPDAIDGMDERSIGRIGSSPTGQYAMNYSKETGRMEGRASGDVENVMAHITGHSAHKDRADHPVPRNVNGKDTFVTRLMVPIINSRNNEVVGGLGCLITIDAIQLEVDKINSDHDEISAMSIYSGNGFIMGSTRHERVGTMLIDTEIQYGERKAEINQIVLDGEKFTLRNWAPLLHTHLNMVLIPFTIGNSDTTWTIMIGASEEYMLAEVNAITRFTVILAALAIAAAAVITYTVLRRTINPIVRVTNTLKDISEGEGDLTHTIPENGNDEITEMSRYFNRTLAKIKNLVVIIKKHTEELSDTGNELAGNMTETAAAINQITANIQSIKNRVTNQGASVAQTNAAMEQITNNIGRLNEQVEQQSASVTQSSSAIEELLANIQSVTQTLIKNTESVNELSSASGLGRLSLENAASDINEIARNSEGLTKINVVMEDIAAQTNLLSMNAAIEASHAGTSGKGFAVVAGEIRKLAENSGEQSKIIGAVLKNIKEAIDKITKSTGNTLTRFQVIDADVKTVSNHEINIRNAMKEQNEGSKQIMEAVAQLNEITQQVRDVSREMFEDSNEVIHESKNLEQATQELTGGINEMASGAEQINMAVNRVNEISVRNRENINLLAREVSRFKVA